MVKLENIQKNDKVISAEYIPEDSHECGFISIDIETGEIVESRTTEFDRILPSYLHHAAKRLREIATLPNCPTTSMVMWY